MQNKANFPHFYLKNEDFEGKQSQFKAKQSQLLALNWLNIGFQKGENKCIGKSQQFQIRYTTYYRRYTNHNPRNFNRRGGPWLLFMQMKPNFYISFAYEKLM